MRRLRRTFYKGQDVAVIGGGNSALQEAVLLSELCSKVTVVQNLDFLTGKKTLADQLYSKENVEIITGATVEGLKAKRSFRASTSKNPTEAPFFCPAAELFWRWDLCRKTSPSRRFATWTAADMSPRERTVRPKQRAFSRRATAAPKRIRQVTTAAADGAVAALAACSYIDSLLICYNIKNADAFPSAFSFYIRLYGIFCRIGLEILLEFLAVAAGSLEGFVDVEGMVRLVDDTYRDVGAMVRRPLKIGYDVRQHKARLDAAISLLHTENVTGTQALL